MFNEHCSEQFVHKDYLCLKDTFKKCSKSVLKDNSKFDYIKLIFFQVLKSSKKSSEKCLQKKIFFECI